MNRWSRPFARSRSVHWGVSVALIVFGAVMLSALALQSYSSQLLVEHKIWRDILAAVSKDHAARIEQGQGIPLPDSGIIRSWYVKKGENAASMPRYLVGVAPGHYSSEGIFENIDTRDIFHALVVDIPSGRLVTVVDVSELEALQNRYSILSVILAAIISILIGGVIAWLHANLVRPVKDLADRLQSMDPGSAGARLPATYRHEELQTIAHATNALLERMERFVERERSLLDQASHEFRTPIAVISGAVDVLKQIPLPETSTPALRRIEHAVADLSETMVALLYLGREADPGPEPMDVTALHELLPRLIQDHEHLLRNSSAQLRIEEIETTFVTVPDSLVRIAVGNLIRNAIENTDAGFVRVSLVNGVVSVADSGSGFDPVEAARRYRDSLRHAAPARGQGLGLFLIHRICDRFGWSLSIESSAVGGTRAALDARASIFVP